MTASLHPEPSSPHRTVLHARHSTAHFFTILPGQRLRLSVSACLQLILLSYEDNSVTLQNLSNATPHKLQGARVVPLSDETTKYILFQLDTLHLQILVGDMTVV